MKIFYLYVFFLILFSGCKKNEPEVVYDDVWTINVGNGIIIDNGSYIRNDVFNEVKYEDFLKYLSHSDHFLIVPMKDFEKTNSTDKVVLTLRHDVDDNINSAVKFAYREHKYGIKSTYYILHTSPYYGVTERDYFKRNDNLIYYLKTIQDSFGHEIGFHNDLVTLQIVYGIDSREFLKTELAWMRGNGLEILGTTSHGSNFCYVYHYVNSYFWTEIIGDPGGNFYNWEYVKKGYKTIKIEKDSFKNYDLKYENSFFHPDYFYSDSDFPGGKRWNMGMINLDTIPAGKKVIILIHPQHWD